VIYTIMSDEQRRQRPKGPRPFGRNAAHGNIWPQRGSRKKRILTFMPVATALAVFFLIWWVVLFAVLPWGVRSQHEGNNIAPGTDPGAPSKARIGWKLVWTTLIAAAIYAVCFIVYEERWVTVDGLVGLFIKSH
jgi:predicted secreted protein